MTTKKKEFLLSYDENDFLASSTASQLRTSLLNAGFACVPLDLYFRSADAASAKELNAADVTIISLTPQLGYIQKFLKDVPDTNIILNLQPSHISQYPDALSTLSKLPNTKVILTPIYSLFETGEPSTSLTRKMELADKQVEIIRGKKFIKYLGSIDTEATIVDEIYQGAHGLIALAPYHTPYYDFCFVEEALRHYHVELMYMDKRFDPYQVPMSIQANSEFKTFIRRSPTEAYSAIRSCKGIISLPSMSNRILGCSDVTALLPVYFGKVNQSLQEFPLVNVRKTVLGTSDIQAYRDIWKEHMLGLLNSTATLEAQKKTLTTENYPGLFIDDGSPFSLLNIVLNNEEMLPIKTK